MVVLNCRVGILYIIESSCPKNPLSVTHVFFTLDSHSWRLISPVRSRILDRFFRWAVTETRQSGLESDIRQTLQVSCHWPSSSDMSVSSEVNNVLFPTKNGVCTASPARLYHGQDSAGHTPPAARLWWRFMFQLKPHFLPSWFYLIESKLINFPNLPIQQYII